MEKVYEFQFDGRDAIVIVPEKPNGEWIWKTEFMYAFDQDKMEERTEFIESLYETRNLRNQYRDGVEVDENSELITLSTCITGQPDKRWIVVAVKMTE